MINKNKILTHIHMNEFQNILLKKSAPKDNKQWFHLYEFLKLAKLTPGDRKQISVCLEARRKRLISKRHKETFDVMQMFLYLDYSDAHYLGVYWYIGINNPKSKGSAVR